MESKIGALSNKSLRLRVGSLNCYLAHKQKQQSWTKKVQGEILSTLSTRLNSIAQAESHMNKNYQLTC